MRRWRSPPSSSPSSSRSRSTSAAPPAPGRSKAPAWSGSAFARARSCRALFGYLLLVLAGLAMLFGHERHGMPTVVFNAYLFNGLMAAAASLAGAFFVHRAGGDARDEVRRGGRRAAADRPGDALVGVDRDASRSLPSSPGRCALGRRLVAVERHRRCCTLLLATPAATGRHRLAGGGARAVDAARAAITVAAELAHPFEGRRRLGLADRLRRARADAAPGRAVLAEAGGARGPRARRARAGAVGALARPGRHRRLGRTPRAPGRGSAGWSCRRRCCCCSRAGRRRDVWPVRAAPGRLPRSVGRGARRRPLALDAGRQRRLRRIGGAAAAPAAAQPARRRRRARARRDPALAAHVDQASRAAGRWRGRGRRLRLAERDPGPRLPSLRRRPVSRRRLARFARGADRHHAALVGDRAGGDVARRARAARGCPGSSARRCSPRSC